MSEPRLSAIIKECFLSADNKEDILTTLLKVIQTSMDFKTNKTIVNYKNQKEIMSDLLEPLPNKGKPIEKIIEEFEQKILKGSVNFSSPNFIAFPDCGNSNAALIGHILYGLLNQNLINSIHTAPTATFVEAAVINWFREAVGYESFQDPKDIFEIGGINVTGGVSANTVGLLLARENKFPGTIETGLLYDPRKIKVFVPKGIGHYSISAALGWLALGKNNLIEVETTSEFKIDQGDLLDKIRSCKKDDVLLALVAYAGDSRTMTIDDFPSLSNIAQEYGMWFHIDACHGLSLCFSDKMREKVKGIECADSVTIDPHKVLFVPYTSSYVLAKDPKKFELVSGVSDLITQESFSFGQITPLFGSRAFNSLKPWFLFKNLGKKTIGKLIENRHEKAKYFASLLDQEKNIYRMNKVEINSVTYLYVPDYLTSKLTGPNQKEAIEAINRLNKEIHWRIFKEGKYYIHSFRLNDFRNIMQTGKNTVFQLQRVMIGNPLTDEKVLDEFRDYLKKTCYETEK
ncbi:pyridoxal-dependent decarboxylase [Candidatus Woesearchaeota archaeon]|nr:pyridoxal-dependent decarboxylase [Candidatus Woesearchaeota archaeon]